MKKFEGLFMGMPVMMTDDHIPEILIPRFMAEFLLSTVKANEELRAENLRLSVDNMELRSMATTVLFK